MVDRGRGFFRRRWRLQFSLLSVFVLMTACAVGVWYWYQRPFVIERKSPVGGALDPFSTGAATTVTRREVETVRRVWGGKTVLHGPRRIYLGSVLQKLEYYRNGQKHGETIDYYPSGSQYFLETFFAGKRHGPTKRFNGDGGILFQGNYEHGLRHGRFEFRYADGEPGADAYFERDVPTGKWSWRPAAGPESGKRHGAIVGQWRDGVPEGRWEWQDSAGERYIVADYRDGTATFEKTAGLQPRTLEALVLASGNSPTLLLRAFEQGKLEIRDKPLKEIVMLSHDALKLPMVVRLPELQRRGIAFESPVSFRAEGTPFLLAFEQMLKPLGLGCDYRYDSLFIDTVDSIAKWHDETGVLALAPPHGSQLEREWNKMTSLDIVAVPLPQVLLYVSDLHHVSMRLSLDPPAGGPAKLIADVPVSVSLRGVSLKNALGAMLDGVDCKAKLEGETLVIEPQ